MVRSMAASSRSSSACQRADRFRPTDATSAASSGSMDGVAGDCPKDNAAAAPLTRLGGAVGAVGAAGVRRVCSFDARL